MTIDMDWRPFVCECGETVGHPDEEFMVGEGLARERACEGCYVNHPDTIRAEAESWEDLYLERALEERAGL